MLQFDTENAKHFQDLNLILGQQCAVKSNFDPLTNSSSLLPPVLHPQQHLFKLEHFHVSQGYKPSATWELIWQGLAWIKLLLIFVSGCYCHPPKLSLNGHIFFLPCGHIYLASVPGSRAKWNCGFLKAASLILLAVVRAVHSIRAQTLGALTLPFTRDHLKGHEGDVDRWTDVLFQHLLITEGHQSLFIGNG